MAIESAPPAGTQVRVNGCYCGTVTPAPFHLTPPAERMVWVRFDGPRSHRLSGWLSLDEPTLELEVPGG